jgi:hypothetical protein
MKASPKFDETVIPDYPRIVIGLNTVPEGSSKKSVLMRFIHQKVLQQHQQKQTVSLDTWLMLFWSVLTRATSAQHRNEEASKTF